MNVCVIHALSIHGLPITCTIHSFEVSLKQMNGTWGTGVGLGTYPCS